MRSFKSFVLNNAAMVALGLLGSGCGVAGTRLYSGPPKAPAELALVMFPDSSVRIIGLQAEDEPQPTGVWTSGAFELPPGHYRVTAAYIASTMSGSANPIEFTPLAGKVYVLFPKFPTKDTWAPVLMDLDAYQQQDCGGGCDSPEEVREAVAKHWRSERPPMTLRSWGSWM
jgi:hypothetical protein